MLGYDRYERNGLGWLAKFSIGSFLSIIGLGGCGGACALTCSLTSGVQYSEGTRTGMINKISQKGLIWKTCEGQMALEGIASHGESVGANVWDFSLDRTRAHGENTDEIVKKIREYLETGTKVKVDYIEVLAPAPWKSGTSHLVLNVEPIRSKQK